MKDFCVAFIAIAGLIGVFDVSRLLLKSRSEPAVTSWPMELYEQAALSGIGQGYAHLSDDLAPITSDANVRAAVVRYVGSNTVALEAARRDLESSAEKRLGVAVVASGGVWVRR
jgi:hypothetical protein